MEQYEAVKAREREQQEELDDARAAARAATLAFEELRQERTDLFMAAFQHVADTIDSVYTVRGYQLRVHQRGLTLALLNRD